MPSSLAGQMLTRGGEPGQIHIRLCYCILSNRVSNEVGVSIIGMCSEKTFVKTPRL